MESEQKKSSKLKFEDLLFPSNRPACPRCGSKHVISRGIEWGCANCGRRWVKRSNWGRKYKPPKKEKKEGRKKYERKEVDREAVKGKDKGNKK